MGLFWVGYLCGILTAIALIFSFAFWEVKYGPRY